MPDLALAGTSFAGAPTQVSATGIPGVGNTYNGPLVYVENMHATDDNVLQISRELKALIDHEHAANGERVITLGAS